VIVITNSDELLKPALQKFMSQETREAAPEADSSLFSVESHSGNSVRSTQKIIVVEMDMRSVELGGDRYIFT
jgi:hypothetical protein